MGNERTEGRDDGEKGAFDAGESADRGAIGREKFVDQHGQRRERHDRAQRGELFGGAARQGDDGEVFFLRTRIDADGKRDEITFLHECAEHGFRERKIRGGGRRRRAHAEREHVVDCGIGEGGGEGARGVSAARAADRAMQTGRRTVRRKRVMDGVGDM